MVLFSFEQRRVFRQQAKRERPGIEGLIHVIECGAAPILPFLRGDFFNVCHAGGIQQRAVGYAGRFAEAEHADNALTRSSADKLNHRVAGGAVKVLELMNSMGNIG